MAHDAREAPRGETDEAARLAREAVGFIAATDNINAHADALVEFAEVLHAGAQDAEAAAVLEHAVALYEEKGNLLGAGRGRKAQAPPVKR